MQFVLEHGLHILNRQMPMSQIHESWTCARSLDAAFVQIDLLLADTRRELLQSWNDLDHRSVHCKVRCNSTSVSQKRVRPTLKGWKPHLNHDQQPGQHHDLLFRYRKKNPRITFDNLEGALRRAGLRGGSSCRDILHFHPSPQLQSLRRARTTTLDAERRKSLNSQIRKFQQREARSWKSEQVRLQLGRVVRCGEWMTDVLTVGLPSNHRQMISQSCCKHCSMGSLRHHNNLYYLQKVLGHCWN